MVKMFQKVLFDYLRGKDGNKHHNMKNILSPIEKTRNMEAISNHSLGFYFINEEKV